MEDNSLSGFVALLKRPSWYVATFAIPFFLDKVINRIASPLRARLKNVISAKPGETAMPIGPEPIVEDDTLNNLGEMLGYLTRFIRPVFALVFFLYVLLNAWALFSHVDDTSGTATVRFIYLLFFAVACAYNILVCMREFSKSPAQFPKLENVLRSIFIPITYSHLAILLYILITQYFFNLLVFSHQIKSDVAAPYVLPIFPALGLLVLKDLLMAKTNSLNKFMILLFTSIEITYILLVIGFWYKTR